MTDTPRKSVHLSQIDGLHAPAVGALLAGTPVEWGPLAAVMQAQDSICGTANRVLVRVGLRGSTQYPVDDSLSTGPGASQNYPDATTWRTIWGTMPRRLTPGCELEAHIVAIPCGMTQRLDGSQWEPDGAQGSIRVRARFRNGSADTGTLDFEKALPASPSPGGDGPTEPGGEWPELVELVIPEIRPQFYTTDGDVAEEHSEWGPGSHASATMLQHEVTLTVQIRGGVRLVELIVYEVPLLHSEAHDETDQQSVHAFEVGGGPPLVAQTTVPQIEAPDGGTNEEHRFGTYRLLDTADWQGQRLGPAVLDETTWRSIHGPPFPADQPPISLAAITSAREIWNAVTTYSEDQPSWLVMGSYALRRDLNEPELVMVNGSRGVLPVRVFVDARVTGAGGSGGYVRVRSSNTEWVDVFVPTGSRAVRTQVGHLESQVHPDQAIARCQVYAWTPSASDTIEIWGLAVEFGDW